MGTRYFIGDELVTIMSDLPEDQPIRSIENKQRLAIYSTTYGERYQETRIGFLTTLISFISVLQRHTKVATTSTLGPATSTE